MEQKINKYALVGQRKIFQDDLALLVCGYIHKNVTKDINPKDISLLILQYFVLNIDWKFGYFYDYFECGPKIHGIKNNGKTFECNHSDWCGCFSISSIGMKPNSGKYSIKIKIDKINNSSPAEIIGLIIMYDENDAGCNQENPYKTNTIEKFKQLSKRNGIVWYVKLDNFIGWSPNKEKNKLMWPNGLYCGVGGMTWNEFIGCRHNYKSRNSNYIDGLPYTKENDIVILTHDSDANILSFNRENDNNKLDAYVDNLPKMQTFYWFVAHLQKPMSVTIM